MYSFERETKNQGQIISYKIQNRACKCVFYLKIILYIILSASYVIERGPDIVSCTYPMYVHDIRLPKLDLGNSLDPVGKVKPPPLPLLFRSSLHLCNTWMCVQREEKRIEQPYTFLHMFTWFGSYFTLLRSC